jgi:aspartate aminotransferase-like enzyme
MLLLFSFFFFFFSQKLVPGPTRISEATRSIYGSRFDDSPDLEKDFFELYSDCEQKLQQKLFASSSHSAVVMSGEAMVVLWGAMKSVLLPQDKIVCVANGVFGDGFVEMGKAVGKRAAFPPFVLLTVLFRSASDAFGV